MARDGEEPGFEFRLAVVLVAALENADPRFLKKIFGAFFVSGDIHQVAEQAVLILLDQAVEQIGVALLEAARNSLRFIAHQRREEQGWPRRDRGPEETGPVWCQT